MAKETKIEWATSTWNPWRGCTPVSPGCDNCYAARGMKRWGQNPRKIVRASDATFHAPLKWKEPKRIFVCSWSDFFHEDVPEQWRQHAWDVMLKARQHKFLILTKRPQNIKGMLPPWFIPYPKPERIWLGVTVESQQYAERIVDLLSIPAHKRFVSYEPALGTVDFTKINGNMNALKGWYEQGKCWLNKLDWVICGGESGPKARPMQIEWVEAIVDQCRSASVPVFVKQDSGNKPGLQGRIPDHLWIKEFPR